MYRIKRLQVTWYITCLRELRVIIRSYWALENRELWSMRCSLFVTYCSLRNLKHLSGIMLVYTKCWHVLIAIQIGEVPDPCEGR